MQNDAAPCFCTKLLHRYLTNTYLDTARMETILEESPDLDWTVVHLTYLLKGAGKPVLVRDGKLGGNTFKTHFVDAGGFIADEIEKREWIRKLPVLGYK
ncbi:MAG: hypothetical protein ACRC6I_16830 [Paracoccaceae bacterium]